jgi:alpha-glucosidase (family GH31 glycosyl hydrolase)
MSFAKQCLRTAIYCLSASLFLIIPNSFGQIGNYASHSTSGRSVVIKGSSDESIRITPYGDYMVRIQTIRGTESFYTDDHYEMVASHDWDGTLTIASDASSLTLSTAPSDGISISITKSPLRLSFAMKPNTQPVLAEKDGTVWSGNTITESFAPTTDEHFVGLGHEAYGRIGKLDRSGTSLKVSTGAEGACIVPFYLSSKGYGVFLNTTFTHTITLCKSNVYSLAIDGEGFGGRMDFFFIAGTDFRGSASNKRKFVEFGLEFFRFRSAGFRACRSGAVQHVDAITWCFYTSGCGTPS